MASLAKWGLDLKTLMRNEAGMCVAGSAEFDGQLNRLGMKIPALPPQDLFAANDPRVLRDLIKFLNLSGGVEWASKAAGGWTAAKYLQDAAASSSTETRRVFRKTHTAPRS